jgi:hypothetical protein
LAAYLYPAFKGGYLSSGNAEDVEKIRLKGLGIRFFPGDRSLIRPLGDKGCGSLSDLVPR